MDKSTKNKKRYWYSTDIFECVICGQQTKDKKRVYKKKERGINWHQDRCWTHEL